MRMDELLQKLKEHDLAAYNYIYETYGWELHNYLLDKCPDKDTSAEVFRMAMNAFCDDLAGQTETDLLELILRTYADRALRERTKPADLPEHFELKLPDPGKAAEEIVLPKQFVPAPQPKSAAEQDLTPIFPNDATVLSPNLGDSPAAQSVLSWDEEDMMEEEHPEKGKGMGVIWKTLLIFLLVILTAVVLWAILGVVVKMGWIPGFRFDLGYSWFNQNIAPWF